MLINNNLIQWIKGKAWLLFPFIIGAIQACDNSSSDYKSIVLEPANPTYHDYSSRSWAPGDSLIFTVLVETDASAVTDIMLGSYYQKDTNLEPDSLYNFTSFSHRKGEYLFTIRWHLPNHLHPTDNDYGYSIICKSKTKSGEGTNRWFVRIKN